jgi:hypothetical protein
MSLRMVERCERECSWNDAFDVGHALEIAFFEVQTKDVDSLTFVIRKAIHTSLRNLVHCLV